MVADLKYFHRIGQNWIQLETFTILSLIDNSRWRKTGCFVRGMKGDRGSQEVKRGRK